MPIQMRPQGGGLPYAPYRDIVNCMPSLARRAAYCLADEYREPWFDEYLKATGTNDEQLGEAAVALAQFINLCRQPELDAPDKVLAKSKFADLPPAAQLAILAKVGQVTLAMFYGSSRDALRVDEKPLALDALLETAEQVCRAFDKSRRPEPDPEA